MKILFLATPVHHYYTNIVKAIARNFDADIDLFVTRSQMTKLQWGWNWVTNKKWYTTHTARLQEIKFREYAKKKYDVIFVLLGYVLNIEVFQRFLDTQIGAYKVLYLWDSLDNLKHNEDCYLRTNKYNSNNFFTLFDTIYSFDRMDCIQNKFRFLPLFYTEDYLYNGECKNIDVCSVGGLHSDRWRILNCFNKYMKEKKLKCDFRLISSFSTLVKRWINGEFENLSLIKFKEISLQENASLLKQSKITIDLPSPGQSGLTMRTLEALAAHTRMITTNADVKNYDFYHPDNISVISWENPYIQDGFLERPYYPVDENIVKKYSINEWIKRIIMNAD